MARADLIVGLVNAGAKGDRQRFRKTVEALIAEERAQQHHVLADRLASHLEQSQLEQGPSPSAPPSVGRSDDLVIQEEPRRQLSDLVLPPGVRDACLELVEEQHRGELLRAHGLEPRNRVLLIGPPGNGKTSLAEAIASEAMLPMCTVRYDGVIASYLGETAVRLARLFQYVRTRRCVLFFDELDALGKERGDLHETGEIKRAVTSLLLQIDALPAHVVVVAATNHPELLDRAVWRRFQLRLELPPPTPEQMVEWMTRFQARTGLTIPRARQLTQRLGVNTFSELEDFCLDVQRRYVLAQPDADLKKIVSSRLAQWEARSRPTADASEAFVDGDIVEIPVYSRARSVPRGGPPPAGIPSG
ncbi:MAG: AAA family ATPase [Sandaracinaceae bacterium]